MNKLLQKAKQRKVKPRFRQEINEEQAELAVAWAHDEIGVVQVAYALYGIKTGMAPTKVYLFLARALKEYIRQKENL